MRAAAAITSITMNGGTLLRLEGTISRSALSSIIRNLGAHCPAAAAFVRTLCPAPTVRNQT
jgi:hypothetical protein